MSIMLAKVTNPTDEITNPTKIPKKNFSIKKEDRSPQFYLEAKRL